MVKLGDIMHGRTCPYCGNDTEFIDSKEIYANGASYGMVYACRRCDAWVGVHKGTVRALGRLANLELRFWKRQAHKWFDPLWQKKILQGCSRTKARKAGYKWLAEQLDINVRVCHVGMFDVDTCKKVVEICKQFFTDKTITNEQTKESKI